MKSIIFYFGCGSYVARDNKDFGEFIVTKLQDIIEKIIPFFKKYPIEGVKSLDYAKFCEVAEIMKTGGHLTPEGLEKIMEIKARGAAGAPCRARYARPAKMNKNRIFDIDFSQKNTNK